MTYLSEFSAGVGTAQALRFYDETLTLHPAHELAFMAGRCLTFLQADEAIATATHRSSPHIQHVRGLLAGVVITNN